MKNELLVPPGAEEDPNAIEVARIWVAKGGQHVSLNPLVWKDPQAWGIVLADLAGHVANAYKQALGLDRDRTMPRITDLLLAELTNPTTKRGARCKIPVVRIGKNEEIKALVIFIILFGRKTQKISNSLKRFSSVLHYSTG